MREVPRQASDAARAFFNVRELRLPAQGPIPKNPERRRHVVGPGRAVADVDAVLRVPDRRGGHGRGGGGDARELGEPRQVGFAVPSCN